MRILHVLPSVDPRGGGPMEGVRRRGLRLREWGHAVELATLDGPSAACVRGFPLPVHALGPGQGRYARAPQLRAWLREHAQRYDAVVVNGLWQYHAYATWRTLAATGQPYHVFTHGMLDPWFRQRYPLKHLKKWLYWPWADYRVLRDAAGVLFTSEEERLRARQSFWLYRARERVVAYGTALPPQDAPRLRQAFWNAHPALQGRRLLLFLGRLHEKKGCDLLLRAFAGVADQEAALHLVMAGPDDAGLGAPLRRLAAELGVAARVSWPGMLQGDLKWGAFHAADLFVLPSHQENFGISVAEALGCGVPVLVSDKVNIWREVQADGAGLVAPDTAEGTLAALQRWLALDEAARGERRAAARRSFEARYTVDAAAHSLLEVLAGAPDRRHGGRP